MAFSSAGGRPFQAEINITPMIDVLLVLIIVFMVVVSMSEQKGLKAQIPQPATDKTKATDPVRTIVIQVAWAKDKQAPVLKINEESVNWGNLHDRLFDIFKQRAERVAFVKGDDDVDFQYVADAIAIARGSGVERIGLLTKTGPESP
jgi:biopolymer transport protein TolR